MRNGKYVIGIVDDDESFRDSTSYFLERNGYEVKLFDSGVDFLHQFQTNARLQYELDLITLDILMPGLNGSDLLNTIRSDTQFKGLKVVIMSSENTLDNRIDLIEAGADDFTAKSDSIFELLARIKARLRDIQVDDILNTGESKSESAASKLKDNGAAITANGEPLDLTASEYKIIGSLLRNLDDYVSKTELETIVFGDNTQGRARALDYHLARIRAKFSTLVLNYSIQITSRRGYGVRLSYQETPTQESKKSKTKEIV
ncbi:DNA-binding response regulator [Actinomycetota bacterium]|nr:DNA-binding response regulator [Actinomycetota bacterium]